MPLAEPELLFARFEMDAGTRGGARAYFQLFITDLTKVQYPLATSVEGPGGRDWGIDTFVGELEGEIFVWQSKFILKWEDKTPQSQVRSSFDSVMKQADEQGHKVKVWTLCVPCNLHPDQQKWFTGWAKRMKSKYGTTVLLLNGSDLRNQLLRQDARDVRVEYFPHTVTPTPPTIANARPNPIATIRDRAQYDRALFVKQLHAAGHEETDAARGLFFATEALFRDYTAKGDQESLEALDELHLDIHEVWEHAFNQRRCDADSDGKIAGLIEAVMERAGARPNPANLVLRPAHKKGAAHRLVEAARAGWVTHWRDIASDHRPTVTDEGELTSSSTPGSQSVSPVSAGRPAVSVAAEGEGEH